MKITGNFSTPNFNRLYIHGKTAESMALFADSKDKKTRETYEENMQMLQDYSENRDILIRPYGKDDKGLQVQFIDSKTFRPTRNIAYNNDFLQGLCSAVRRLKNGTKTSYMHSFKKVAYGRNLDVKPPIVIDAEQLNKLA